MSPRAASIRATSRPTTIGSPPRLSPALLVHAVTIDGTMSDLERDKLHAVIKRRFGLDEAATDELVLEATEAEHEAVDLYHFTSLINRSLDEDGRRRVGFRLFWA